MLGIMNTSLITVDYSKAVEDVFLEAVGAMLLEGETHLGSYIYTCNALTEGMIGGKLRLDAKKMVQKRPTFISLESSAEQSRLMVEYYRKILAGENPVLGDHVLEKRVNEPTR